MVIAIDVSPVLPGGENGGMKKLLYEILKGFEKKAVSDTFILLTSYKNDYLFKEFDNPRLRRFCVVKDASKKNRFLQRVFDRTFIRKLKLFNNQNFLKKNGVAVLFCPFAAPTFTEVGIPTVSLIADLQHMYYPSFFSKQELSNRNFFYDQVKKKADYIVAISSYTKQTIIEKLDIRPERVFAIPISLRSRFYPPRHAATRSVLEGLKCDGKKYCIYPANLWPHKNHKVLLAAFNMFQKKYPQLDLHLVLTGEKIRADIILFDSIKQMGILDKVHFTGYLPEKSLVTLWRHSYFLVYPSLFEGFGIPLVEAMKYKKPILASRVTSIPEVAGDAAVYFNPKKPVEIADALYRIMTDKKLYDSLVKKGQKHLRKYDFDEMVDCYFYFLHQAGEKKEEKNKVIVSGIFRDGWAGEKIHVAFNKFRGERIFELKAFLPGWHPAGKMKIRVGRFSKSSQYHLHKGSELYIKEKLSNENGRLNISASKSFIPGNNDKRRLSFRVHEFSVLDEQTGEKIYEFKPAE